MTVDLKIPGLELHYDGPEDFFQDKLPALLTRLAAVAPAGHRPGSGKSKPDLAHEPTDMSTATIAALLDCQSGPDLVLAACAHLSLTEGLATYSRQQILKDMKLATGYFKTSYSNNLSSSLTSQVKAKKLLEPTKGSYTLSSAFRKELEGKLAAEAPTT